MDERNVYTKRWNGKGFAFIQTMNLENDTAYYHSADGKLLMEVDSHGNCKDGEGNPFGRFVLDWRAQHWNYEAVDGTKIETPFTKLFDQAEPHVVAKLFASKAAEAS
ncbi:hypothetical protein [Burkholderia phage BCSR5]|nr:hypothetical protein [Burkholderia phage BCSR5]